MFGHIESDAQRVRHLALLRELQRETGGFTEIVPLSFIHAEAPAFVRRLLPELRPGASEQEVIRLYAIARLMLGSAFRNLQVSWVKQGLVLAARILGCGANDLGGTLINESISTSAGAPHGQLVSPARLRAAIRAAGRVPAERSTLYAIRRVFSADGHDDPVSPLDAIADPDAVFGSYAALVRDERFRFRGGPPGRRADGWLAAAHRAGSRAEALDEDAPAGTAAAD
jgi:FO synthase subunit 2